MNNKRFVIFKNPNLKYRKEDFGGIAKAQFNIFLINKKQYNLIDSIKKVLIYDSLDYKNKKIADKLIKEGILLSIDLDRAKELGFKDNTPTPGVR